MCLSNCVLAAVVDMTIADRGTFCTQKARRSHLRMVRPPVLELMIQRIRTYKSNFGSVIIGEIETFAIYRTDYVIWGKDDWALDGLDMHQGLPSDSCLENLND